jgi:cytoskeletal protein CcmA (bactofilin family)
MRSRRLLACLAFVASANGAGAQRNEEGNLLLRVGGGTHVGPADSVGTAVVIRGNAVIEGAVGEDLLVVRGNARVSGRVHGDLVVMNGHAELAPGARVDGDVLLYASTLARSPGAVVTGQVHEERGLSFGARAIWLFWLAMTLMLIIAGLAFAALAARSLIASSAMIGAATAPTLLTALLLWIGLPALAFFAFVTVIGIPLGFVILFFVLPALTLIGYLVTSTALGRVVMSRRRPPPDTVGVAREPLYAEVAIGVLILQLIGFIPGLGGLVIILAGLLGAGALVYFAWSHRQRGEVEPVVVG